MLPALPSHGSQPIPAPAAFVPLRAGSRHDALRRASALIALTKPRLATFSVLTAMGAYVATPRVEHGVGHVFVVLLGTALSAGGALALNQWWERDLDGRMRRTRNRPLPREQLSPALALGWSSILAVAGVAILATLVNGVAAAIATATILSYAFIYTPLKRRTRWATEVGAISGALPPLLGAAAAGDVASPAGLILNGLLLLWQMPHFFAIGWMYRDDYRAAGFPLLPAVDATGARTGAWTFGYTLALVVASLVPWLVGAAGAILGCAATVGGAWMLWCAWLFATVADDRDSAARRLFLASVLYLPLVLGALMVDRLA
jgi:protoheme IX farnesyltransferase